MMFSRSMLNATFLEVDEVMVEDTLVLQMFLYQLSYVEDLFLC